MPNEMLPDELILLARAVDSTNSSLIITDQQLPDHPIIFCNRAFERLTGYAREEIIGRNCRFLQGADADQPSIKDIRSALAAGCSCIVSVRNSRKDGSIFWNELVLSPVCDSKGSVTHFIGIQKDITERMVGRNAAMDRVTLVSHELKTPLTIIKSTLQLIQQRGVAIDESFLQQSLPAALRAVNRLEQLGKSILN